MALVVAGLLLLLLQILLILILQIKIFKLQLWQGLNMSTRE